jgi:hypothetical protein
LTDTTTALLFFWIFGLPAVAATEEEKERKTNRRPIEEREKK